MFKNRIEFRNLYGTNTIDSIMSQRDVEVRNKTTIGILEVLNKVIENRHTGIRTMINEMKKAELPKPIFENKREDFSVIFYNGEYLELYPEEIKNTQVRNIDKLILEFCKNEKSAKEIADNFEDKGLKRNHLKPLIEKGFLQMTNPDKPKSSKQKYIAISNKIV